MNSPETGDKVRYVDENSQIFDANVQAAFKDGPVNIRISDTNYDITRVAHDPDKAPVTWHWPEEEANATNITV